MDKAELTFKLQRIRFFELCGIQRVPKSPRRCMQLVSKYICKQFSIDPSAINYGYCYFWALLVHDLVPETKIVTEPDEDHVFLLYNGKRIDSSTFNAKLSGRPSKVVLRLGQRHTRRSHMKFWIETGKYSYSWWLFLKAYGEDCNPPLNAKAGDRQYLNNRKSLKVTLKYVTV